MDFALVTDVDPEANAVWSTVQYFDSESDGAATPSAKFTFDGNGESWSKLEDVEDESFEPVTQHNDQLTSMQQIRPAPLMETSHKSIEITDDDDRRRRTRSIIRSQKQFSDDVTEVDQPVEVPASLKPSPRTEIQPNVFDMYWLGIFSQRIFYFCF